MGYKLRFTKNAGRQLDEVKRTDPAKHSNVAKCLRKISEDPKQTGLNSHKFISYKGPSGEEVWESYVENRTPAAWRVFWCYGADQKEGEGASLRIVKTNIVVAITPHP